MTRKPRPAPGAICDWCGSVLLATDAHGQVVLLGTLIGVIATVIAICFISCLIAGRVAHFFGTAANLVVTRLLGVLLASLAVQYVVDGGRAILRQ